MKNIQKKSFFTKTRLVIIIAGILVLVGGGLAFAYSSGMWPYQDSLPTATKDDKKKTKDSPTQASTSSEPTEEEITAGQEAKKQTIDDQSQPPSQTPLSVTISAANQNGSVFQIRAFANIVSNSATCQLTLTKGSTKVTKTADTQASASISTCKGFDIPVSELSSGRWEISITITNGSQTGSASVVKEIS